MKFDVQAARRAGYSDDEINAFLAQERNFDLQAATQAGYSSFEILNFLTRQAAPAPAPAIDTQPIDYGDAATEMMGTPMSAGATSRAARTSVLDVAPLAPPTPSPEQRQAEIDKRLSYGAGPISPQTVATADALRGARITGKIPDFRSESEAKRAIQVARKMDERGERSTAQVIQDIVGTAPTEEELDAQSRQRFAAENPILGSLAAGSAGLISGTMNIPSVAADAFNEIAVNPVLRALGMNELPRVPTAFGTEYLTKAASDFMPKVGKQEMDVAVKRDEFAPWLMSKLAANSPQIAQSLVAAFIPPLRAAMLPGMAGTAAGQSFVEGDDSRVALAKGAVEYLSEKLPLGVFDKVGDTLKGMSPVKANTVLAVAGQRLLQAGGAITANTLTNAIEEVAAQFGGNVLDKYFQGKEIELTKGLAEAGVVGGATGKLMSLPQAGGALAGAYDPNRQIAREIDSAGGAFDRLGQADSQAIAIDMLRTERGTSDLISPAATVANFTPPDSPTKQAGLVDIAVPLPGAPGEEVPTVPGTINPATEQQFGLDKLRMGGANVGTGGALGGLAGQGSGAGGGLVGGSMGPAGPGNAGAVGPGDGLAGVPGANDRQAVPAGGATGQQAAGLTGAAQPLTWTGRAKTGYANEQDAEQAMATASTVIDTRATHDWRVEPMGNGRFQIVGYQKGTNLEATTTAAPAVQGQEGQAAGALTGAGPTGALPAGAPPAAGAAAAAQLPGLESAGLRTAPTAPIREIKTLNTELSKELGITVAPVKTADMSDQQKLASAVARLLGKTLTVVRQETGTTPVPNGMINRLGGKHIYVAEDSEDAPLFVAMHEAYHGLPDAQRKTLNQALLQTFRAENQQAFLNEFGYDASRFEEEAPAMIAQVVSKREDFWQDLRTKMGNKEFGEVAKVILTKLTDIVTGAKKQYGDDFVSKYITDIAKARDLLSTAYAESMQAQGLKPDVTLTAAQPMASGRAAADGQSFLKATGFSDSGPAAGEWVKPVSKLGDVIAKVVSAPGEPVRMEISADYMGRRFGTKVAEGEPAIKAAIEWASSGIQQGREKLAARFVAEERGLPGGARPPMLTMASERSRIGLDFKDVIKRTPELQAAAAKVRAGEMTAAEYDRLVNEAKPVEAYTSVPQPASMDEAVAALKKTNAEREGSPTKDTYYGKPSQALKAGDPVGLRLDIPSYSKTGTWVVTVHEPRKNLVAGGAGTRIGYESVAAATGVQFSINEKGAIGIAAGKEKNTIATMEGKWKPTTPAEAKLKADQALKSKEWIQVGMDPERHSYFYDRATMEPVTAADEVIQIGPLVLAKNPTYGKKSEFMFSQRAKEEGSAGQAAAEGKRVGSVETHILAAVRGERSMAERTVLSAEEKTKIRAGAAKLKVPVSELEAQVREHKAAHPVEDEWAPLTFTGVKKDDVTGKYDLQYKTVPYEFSNGANGKALQPGTPAYKTQVDRMARGMLAAVRSVYQRAIDGDAAARKIIDQSGWYKEMRTRLRQEFGGLGDLFADLLGATSPNTPVRTNWDNSVEALRLLSQGKFDNLVPQWIAWAQRVDEVETRFRAWFNERRKSGMSKAAIKKTSEYKEFAREAAAARELPDNLMPTKANGKKFGFNGGNVVRAIVDLWRVVKNADPDINRGGTAPKAINFSGNLIGFRARATIDVWAARMLQRLAGGSRIPSMAEGGVSGQALEDGRNTLQFGFGQDVFGEAVKLIRNDAELSQDATLRSINDDDLQALVWFIEKEVWTKGNWTSAAGEGGSFELESDLAGIKDRDAVTDLRRIADSSVATTAEQRAQATADIARVRKEIESVPAIAQANAVLDRNAQRLVANKTAKPEDKLTGAQKKEIAAENAAARKDIAKARKTVAVKDLEKQISKAQRTLGKPTVEQSQASRAAAVGKLKQMSRTVDRFVGGLSIQQGDQQPTDTAMSDLANSIEKAVISVDDGATVIGLKAISTQGRYGSVERALDLEVIARAGFNARPMAAAVFTAARDANQDSAFVARVLRPDEKFDPLKHRPGIEIYFRDMKQAEEAAKMMAQIAGKRIAKTAEVGPGYFEVAGYTIIVDGRRTPTTRSGAMGTPVGMRIIYMPEFEARYGLDPRLADATENNIGDIIRERADNLGNFADEVLRKFDGVSFAGRFDYEVDTRFAGEYQGAIDAYSSAASTAGADQSRSQAWQGRTVRESIAAAVGRVSVDGGQQGGELLGGDQVFASNRIAGDRGGRQAGRGLAPLEGAPSVTGYHGPDPRIVAVAEQYARDNGIDLKRQAEYAQVDPERAKRISNAYEVMRHAPQDPKVKEAYENLIRQTTAQYRALEAAGYKFWFIDTRIPENAEYASTPWNAMRDLRSNQQMGVFPTSDGFGSEETGGAQEGNPMVQGTGIKWPVGGPDGPLQPVLANDLFRAVHDAFGHGMEGAGFREHGEENAWQAHVRLFTGSAVGAITSETRGQNLWLNYGPYGEKNRTAKVEDTVFADQKTGLMPEWTWTEGRVGDMPGITASNRAATPKADPELASIFKDLDGARGLGRIRAQERVDAHPMAETIRQIDKDFLDILERLDDAGLVKINCK